jgi:hypothetical protein
MRRTTSHRQWKLIAAAFAVMAASAPGLVAGPVAQASSQAVEGAQFSGSLATAGCNTTTGSQVVTVHWGDGQTTSGSFGVDDPTTGQTPVKGSHTYAEEGAFNGSVDYTDDCGTHHPTFQIQVADAALSASGVAISATAGTPFAGVVAHFSDADPNGATADYTATITWGDGSSSHGGVQPSGTGFAVSGSHTYGRAGSYALSLVISDAGGAGTTASGTATIAPPDTTTTSTTSTTTTSTSGGAPVPVRAAFAALPSSAGHLILDASSSRPSGTGVGSYAWNLDGHTGPEPSALCSGDASQLSTRLAAGVHSLTLMVTDTSGVRTSVTHQFTIPPGPPAPIAHSAHGPSFVHVFDCSPGPSDNPGDVTAQGGPPAGCANEVQFGLADAVGCLKAITQRADWPAAEGKIIHQLTLGIHACPGCAGAARAASPSISLASLEQSLSATQDPYFSTGAVRINGIDFYPAPGASILLVPNQNYVISSDATMKLGGVTLKRGLVIMYVPQGAGNANKVHVDDYTLSDELKKLAPGVGDLPFDGSIGLDLVYHRAQLPTHIKLPDVFSADPTSSDPITGGVTLSTDNSHGLLLDSVDISVPEAFLGPLEVDNLFFHYQREGDIWNGGADVVFPGAKIKATPPPPDNGFGLKAGAFDHAGATVTFDEPIEIFTGVDLTHISFSLGLNPTRFTGGVGLDVVDIVHVDGSLAMVFASSGAPYVFPANAGPGLEPIAGHRVSSPAFAAGGTVSLVTPIGDLGLGSAYLLYVFPDYLEFGGGFYYDFGVGHIDGHIFGAVQPSKAKFDLEGGLHACIDDLGCLGVDGVVSSRGIAACLDTFVADVGVGDYWGHFPDIYFHGCDIGPYTDRAAAARSAAAITAGAGSTRFTLGAGLPFAMVKATGASDAPEVMLTGPHGEQVTAPSAPRYIYNSKFGVLRQRKSRTTFIGIKRPAAGTWTLSALPGSSPITAVRHANGLAQPQIHVRVLGRGRTRTLAYRIKSLAGRQVTFAEQGSATARVLGRTTAAHGRLRFTPGPGPGGRRKILATIVHNGLQSKRLTVASYTAPAPPRPGKPSNVKVTRRRGGLTITWRRAHDATRYAVAVALSDGRRLLLLTRAGKRAVRVGGVGPSVSGSVRVTGLTSANSASRPGTVRFKRLRRPRPAPLPRLVA